MKFRLQNLALCFSAAFLIATTEKSDAFALLGPVQPWMQSSNGVIQPGDIGGPMCISNEYRWNVPVLTYGFDQSFSNYFGTNGISAVESAIQILNDLPPASQIVLTNYPFYSQHANFTAQSESLIDIKSVTLSLLLEHLGLTQPTRNIFVIQQWNPTNIIQLNFDPQTLAPSSYVNNTLYSYGISSQNNQQSITPFPVNPNDFIYNAVADLNLNDGFFYQELTYDDIGGLVYLLSTNNVNYETLLPSVVGAGTNANLFVNGAWRPGVNKITFIPQPVDSQSGAFLPTTNYFTDSYITNGALQQQQMARIISQPDFLFYAGDINQGTPSLAYVNRTGTTNWINNAALNGNPNGAGPGIIQPSVRITFNKVGRQLFSSPNSDEVADDLSQLLGTFDSSTNLPIIYPAPQTGTNQLTVRMWLVMGSRVNNYFVQSLQHGFDWSMTSPTGATFLLQTSTNLTDWVSLDAIQNDGSVCTYFNTNPKSPSRFYRLVPQ